MTDSLYVLEDGAASKIGFTSRPLEKRLKEYNTHNPHFQLASHIEVNDLDLRSIENAIKAFYKPYKIKNRGEEWFDIPATQMSGLVNLLVTQAQQTQSSQNRSYHHVPVSEIAERALSLLEDSLTVEWKGKSKKKLEDLQKQIDDRRNVVRKEFSSAFGLGFSNSTLQTSSLIVAAKNICPPDLRQAPEPRAVALTEAIFRGGGRIHPPHMDHNERFYVTAPLATGAVIAFCSALIVMPYSPFNEDWEKKRKEIKDYADIVGWSCTEHSEWSWHAPRNTGLIILQPKTPMHEILGLFEISFRKFIIEREKKYALDSQPRVPELAYLIANDACFPLDAEGFDDLYDNYIRKYCCMRFDFIDEDDKALSEAYKFLFSEWEKDKEISRSHAPAWECIG